MCADATRITPLLTSDAPAVVSFYLCVLLSSYCPGVYSVDLYGATYRMHVTSRTLQPPAPGQVNIRYSTPGLFSTTTDSAT